jgi:long-chain acyl-CoA synthetase
MEQRLPTEWKLVVVCLISVFVFLLHRGMPKGVMLPHSTMVSTMGSIERYFVLVGGQVETEDVFLSYLPLAHVFDFVCECCILFRGAKIGFYRGDQKTLVDDIGALKPTIFVGVPRVFDRIYKRVNALMDEGSPAKKLLFLFFFDQKLAALKKGVKWDQASFIGDALIFSKIKARLGGRVRIIASGGAPLPQHLEDWLKVTMCCPVVQGYGLTETCAASCVSMPDRADQRGTVGPPLFSNECKLVPVPELGYDGTPEGGGEICFRGPSIMSGYYKSQDLTDEVLTKDGWFHTGDIGRIGVNGCVTIVDRKKQLFKLLQGEYVSPEKVEGIAAKSPLVGQIWVCGSSMEACVVAVIVPSDEAIKKYGGKEAACQSSELESSILEDLERVCRAEKLKGYEIPKAVLFHPEEWTPESGYVTPSFKLKRPALQKHFQAEIDGLYAVLNAKPQASNW